MEFVYVVKREQFEKILPRNRVDKLSRENFENLQSEGFFIERRQAERDPQFKQLIPYVVVRRGKECFLFKRLKGGGEKRLHNLYSVGVGGHINPVELSEDKDDNIVLAGAKRELLEEISLEIPADRFEILGLLNDESNEVGTVHTGVVLQVNLETDEKVKIGEEKVLQGEFRNFEELISSRNEINFENWSSLVLDFMGK
ncbi:MAG: NUDIX domain-containing protein [Deltaproteobacteria bacterium]|jgi:predicted NUDIX family phosphoesterase|nr:NUDIX domain-containing protein [Deltaproteobacteria bacterium]